MAEKSPGPYVALRSSPCASFDPPPSPLSDSYRKRKQPANVSAPAAPPPPIGSQWDETWQEEQQTRPRATRRAVCLRRSMKLMSRRCRSGRSH
mmetsp:Transcript_49392/g.123875  ORF Transcript_49392/g.123875 Transcript_49392/m.123875 type:complete len:93 (+) Transcript_49392:310-588(+)